MQVNTPLKGENFPPYVVALSRRRSETNPIVTTPLPTTSSTTSYDAASEAVKGSSSVALLSCLPPPLPTSTSSEDPATPQGGPLNEVHDTNTRKNQTLVTECTSNLTPQKPQRAHRPSLSDQLRAISQRVDGITTQLKKTSTGSSCVSSSSLLFSVMTWNLVVGKVSSKLASPIAFHEDRCEYLFQHPFEAKEILMIMFYRDMTNCSVNVADKKLSFKVLRPLSQFGNDYLPSNVHHSLQVFLMSSQDAIRVRQLLQNKGLVVR